MACSWARGLALPSGRPVGQAEAKETRAKACWWARGNPCGDGSLDLELHGLTHLFILYSEAGLCARAGYVEPQKLQAHGWYGGTYQQSDNQRVTDNSHALGGGEGRRLGCCPGVVTHYQTLVYILARQGLFFIKQSEGNFRLPLPPA